MVAYPPHGVGRISAREKKIVLGVEEEVVVIELGNELSVTLPVSRATELLRPPATPADLKRVQKTLREDGVVSDEIWSKRLQHAQEKLRSGDPIDLAEIVRDGVKREQGRTATGTPIKLSTSERALHLKARELLSRDRGSARYRSRRSRSLDRPAAGCLELGAPRSRCAAMRLRRRLQILRRGAGEPHFERPRLEE